MSNEDYYGMHMDYEPKPYVTNVSQKAIQNSNYRTTLWTGLNTQMTLMCIPTGSDIGLEFHKDNDQLIRIEQGVALVKMGSYESQLDYQVKVCTGYTIFVPSGTWHNVINIGKIPLKLSAVYAPPHHPAGTVHRTKRDSEMADY